MDTKLIDGIAPLPEDKKLLAAFKRKFKDGDGQPSHLGICNADGKVYRTITTHGLNGFMDAVEALNALGFRDAWKGREGDYGRLSGVFALGDGPAECER